MECAVHNRYLTRNQPLRQPTRRIRNRIVPTVPRMRQQVILYSRINGTIFVMRPTTRGKISTRAMSQYSLNGLRSKVHRSRYTKLKRTVIFVTRDIQYGRTHRVSTKEVTSRNMTFHLRTRLLYITSSMLRHPYGILCESIIIIVQMNTMTRRRRHVTFLIRLMDYKSTLLWLHHTIRSITKRRRHVLYVQHTNQMMVRLRVITKTILNSLLLQMRLVNSLRTHVMVTSRRIRAVNAALYRVTTRVFFRHLIVTPILNTKRILLLKVNPGTYAGSTKIQTSLTRNNLQHGVQLTVLCYGYKRHRRRRRASANYYNTCPIFRLGVSFSTSLFLPRNGYFVRPTLHVNTLTYNRYVKDVVVRVMSVHRVITNRYLFRREPLHQPTRNRGNRIIFTMPIVNEQVVQYSMVERYRFVVPLLTRTKIRRSVVSQFRLRRNICQMTRRRNAKL